MVVVSTDDDEIAAASEAEGAIVVRRPADLASSTASSESAVLHALWTLEQHGTELPPFTLLVQCTSPFVAAEDLDLVVDLIEDGADSCFTASPTHAFLWGEDALGAATPVNHDGAERRPRQQLPPQYVETGAVYGFRTGGFVEHRRRFFGRIKLAVVDAHRTLEIDEPFDLQLAQHWSEALDDQRRQRALPATVRAVVFDFDGVMTDNRALVLADGRELVAVNRGDGFGLARLRDETDVALLVLSGEHNAVVSRRSEKLGIECLAGVADKGRALQRWLAASDIEPGDCVYVGNDLNDLDCMAIAGCAVAPADAMPEIRSMADLVLRHAGGQGAVRELVDLLFADGHVSSRVAGDLIQTR